MKYMNNVFSKKILSVLILITICSISNAQVKKDSVPPLFRFLQNNFDSTIVSGFSSNWRSTELPRYDIISIKNDSIYFFSYKNPYPYTYSTGGWPKSLSAKFSKENLAFTKYPADTNRYFFPVELHRQTSAQVKKRIDSLSVWTIRDDAVDGEGCAECKCSISDAGCNNFYLITHSGIKKLSFYALDFYMKRCKPREGRQRILQVINIFKGIF